MLCFNIGGYIIPKVRPLDKLRLATYHLTVGAVLVTFVGFMKVESESQMAYRQDFEEWKMSVNNEPTVKIGYNDYKRMLELVQECAMVLERSVPMIEDNDLLLVPLNNPNLTQKFDCHQLSNQAFEELEESLGLGN